MKIRNSLEEEKIPEFLAMFETVLKKNGNGYFVGDGVSFHLLFLRQSSIFMIFCNMVNLLCTFITNGSRENHVDQEYHLNVHNILLL